MQVSSGARARMIFSDGVGAHPAAPDPAVYERNRLRLFRKSL
jgi:hypothetical protein